MSSFYPWQTHGRYRLAMGLSGLLVHENYGVDLSEKFYHDIAYRVKTSLEIDRAVYETYGRMGLGSKNPTPRLSVEPYGHRFMGAMYDCEPRYLEDGEPWVLERCLSGDEIRALESWTVERFENSEPVKVILSQIDYLKKNYECLPIPTDQFIPHYRPMSSLQNLGSVINNAFSVQNEKLYMDYIDDPEAVHLFYNNITDLMILAMDYFSKVDGWPLTDVFIGNCSIAMISPENYQEYNYPYDHRLMDYARSIDATFMIHQDSDVTQQLENYAGFDFLHGIDFGQDTDFEKAAELMPHVDVNCLLFPFWINTHSDDEIREELLRLMDIGKKFQSMSFCVWEIDPDLGGDKIFSFYDIFCQCAKTSST